MKKETSQKLLKLSQKEYDQYASEFSTSRKFFWSELEFIKKYVKKNDKVLDIGCGNGRLSDILIDKNIQYTGIDFSKELINIAKKERKNNGNFIQANALSLPFKDNSFDVIFSIAVLHHIPSKENRLLFISEVNRVLKPEGIFIVTTWNTLNWKFAKKHLIYFLKKIFGYSKLDFGDIILTFGKNKRKRYIHSLTKKELKKIITKNNFVDISIKKIKRKSGHSNFISISKKTH